MIRLLSIFLLLSLNVIGQNATVPQVKQLIADSNNKAIRPEMKAINNAIQVQIAALKATDSKLDANTNANTTSINKIIADSTFLFDPKTLAAPKGVLTVIAAPGGNVPVKWMDSVNVVLAQQAKDIKQLYLNDAAETAARVKADNEIKESLRITDSITAQNNISIRGISYSNKLLAQRVDSLSLALIQINQSITDLQNEDKLTDARLKVLTQRCDAIKSELDATKLTIPKGVQLTY